MTTPKPQSDADLDRRRKLTGRIMVIGLVLLAAAYAAVTFIR